MNTYEILVSSLSVLVAALIGFNLFTVFDFRYRMSQFESKSNKLLKEMLERSFSYANCYGLLSNATTMLRDGHTKRGVIALFGVLETANKIEWPEPSSPIPTIIQMLLDNLCDDEKCKLLVPERSIEHFIVILHDTGVAEALELADRLKAIK